MSDLLVCFHGSPGLPDEFEGLAESLPGVEVRAVVRYGYPSFRQYPRQGDLDERCIVVGYSFGCVAALKAAAYRPKNVEAAILIAPYLFVERPLGALKRALLATPGISTLLLRSAGPKAIAHSASSGAKATMPMVASRAPVKEASADIDNAGPARPFLASG